jgi:hypothetical protein
MPKKIQNIGDFIEYLNQNTFSSPFTDRPSIRSKASNISRYFFIRRV